MYHDIGGSMCQRGGEQHDNRTKDWLRRSVIDYGRIYCIRIDVCLRAEDVTMTTIAYRDGILAVDRQMAHGHYIRETDCKLQLVHNSYSVDYAIAFTGTISMGKAFVKWMEEGCVEGGFPIKDIDRKSAFHALTVQRTGSIPACKYWGNDLIPISEDDAPYAAQGSGDEFALGAMYQGATAIEAVQAANKHCAWSGYGVLYVDVAGDFEIKRAKV
jgi:hypothetical protein